MTRVRVTKNDEVFTGTVSDNWKRPYKKDHHLYIGLGNDSYVNLYDTDGYFVEEIKPNSAEIIDGLKYGSVFRHGTGGAIFVKSEGDKSRSARTGVPYDSINFKSDIEILFSAE